MYFRIFIAGEWGGRIVVNHDYPELDNENDIGNVPHGTCGIRWHDPDVWYWENLNVPIETLPNSESHPNFNELFFSGPYPGCAATAYTFPFPLTLEGHIPFETATALTVQVASAADVEYLDSDGAIIPAPPPPGTVGGFQSETPTPPDICELAREFCDDIDSFVENPCESNTWHGLCGAAENVSRGTIRMHDLVNAVLTHTTIAQSILYAPDSTIIESTYALAALQTAKERLTLAQRFVSEVRYERDLLVRSIHQAATRVVTRQFAGSISTSVQLGSMALTRSAKRLERILSILPIRTISVRNELDLLHRDCQFAIHHFSNALLAIPRLKAWALPVEDSNPSRD